MGREIRKVPLGFDLALGKTWGGLVYPGFKAFDLCAECEGSGWDEVSRQRRSSGDWEFPGEKFFCSQCEGRGDVSTEDERQDAESHYTNWEENVMQMPPVGDGWQLWQTVSEGGPVSPVFPDAEGLAVWMSQNDATAIGPVEYKAALAWINESGWSPSVIMVEGKFLAL